MLKHKGLFFGLFSLFIVLSILSLNSIDYLQKQRDELILSKNLEQVEIMRKELSSMIFHKQKATVAMALAMSNDSSLAKNLNDKKIENDYYLELIKNFKKHTLYKNIWVQIFDKEAVSLYRSWSPKKGDSLLKIREDLEDVIESKKISFSISVGKFDLSIKAIVPVFHEGKFVGIVEVISHFNSIAHQLTLHDVNSVVLLKKEYKKQLIEPFTKTFLDEYYVANFNALDENKEYLKRYGVENYFTDSHKIENGYLIVSYPLSQIDSKVIAYFIMFKKIDSIKNLDLDFYMFKAMAFLVITVMTIAVIISSLLYYANQRQRKYYKNIIDSSSNIVLVNKKKKMLLLNRVFFQYFPEYKNIDEFKKEHDCICDFFIEEDEYIGKTVEGLYWVDYINKNREKDNKVKIKIGDKDYYFSITASEISDDSGDYSVVLSDITLAETYKHELENLTVTDALTGIGNRRYFHQKMQEEISRAKRNETPLSVIMFDIDYFKSVNDKYGHDVGDEVLREYTKLIAFSLRETDVFARIGGEEFIIILPNVTKEDAMKLAEKFRSEVEVYKKVVPITMSFGVTEYIKGEDIEFIFKRVDSALYRAKEAGRNRVDG
ncbi:MAG: diguanylate cyclase [Campylobacterota bacterium]|nr:diguanylate cyclase [Campylobacterota bacterium]